MIARGQITIANVDDGENGVGLLVTPFGFSVKETTGGLSTAKTVTVNIEMKVGDNNAVFSTSTFSVTSKPTQVTVGTFSAVSGSDGKVGKFDITVPANKSRSDYEGVVKFTVQGTHDGKSYTCSGGVAIGVSEKGEKGTDGTNGTNGTSPYYADLSNQMDSIQCSDAGTPKATQTVKTDVCLFHGQIAIQPYVASVKRNGQVMNPVTPFEEWSDTGVTVSFAYNSTTQKYELTVEYTTQATISNKKDVFSIKVIDNPSGESFEGDKEFTVNALSSDVYNLFPSKNQISVGRTDAGGYSPTTATLTCGYKCRDIQGNITTVANSTTKIDNKYFIYFRRRTRGGTYESDYILYNGGTTTYYANARTLLSSLDVTTYDSVEFYLTESAATSTKTISGKTVYYRASMVSYIDIETVPVVCDGVKGNSGVSVTGVTTYYCLSTSPTTEPADSAFSTTYPTWQNGKYLWTRTKTEYSSGDPTWSAKMCVSGSQGAVGKTILPPMKFVNDGQTTYYNDNTNGQSVVMFMDGTVLKYYKYIGSTSPYTPTSSDPYPNSANASTLWEQFSYTGNIATDVLLANQGYIDVLGAGRVWVGQNDYGNGVDGWVMTHGEIFHNKTGFKLTSDGYLVDPDGLHFKVGDTTKQGENLFFNAYFDQLLATATGTNNVGYSVSLGEAVQFGKKCLVLAGEASGASTLQTSFMGGSEIGKGIRLTTGYYTFSFYARANSSGVATVKLQFRMAKDEEITTLIGASRDFVLDGTFKRYTYTFQLTSIPYNQKRYVGFNLYAELAAGAEVSIQLDAVKLERGQSATQMSDTSVSGKLLPTGIDIEERKITLTADQLECQNNEGEKTAWLDELGNFNTRGIQSKMLQVADTLKKFCDLFVIWVNRGWTREAINLATIGDEGTAEELGNHYYDDNFYVWKMDGSESLKTLAVNPIYKEVDSNTFWIIGASGSSYWFYCSLDMRSADGMVELAVRPSTKLGGISPETTRPIIVLPYLKAYAGNVYDFIRTPTKMNTGELHYITLDEIKSLVGRRLVLVNRCGTEITVYNGENSIPIQNNQSAILDFVMEEYGQGTFIQDANAGYNYTVYYPKYYWKPDNKAMRNVEESDMTDENFGKTFTIV